MTSKSFSVGDVIPEQCAMDGKRHPKWNPRGSHPSNFTNKFYPGDDLVYGDVEKWLDFEVLGADVGKMDQHGNTLLHICSKTGFVHNNHLCIQNLLVGKCEVIVIYALQFCATDVRFQPNKPNQDGLIPLHVAAAWGTEGMILVLLTWASDRDKMDKEYVKKKFCPRKYWR